MTRFITIHNNAFRPQIDSERRPIVSGNTIWEILSEQNLVRDIGGRLVRTSPYLVYVDGELVLQERFNQFLMPDQMIHVVRLPRGGGGGSNLKNLLAAIVIAVAAFFTFGLSLVATAAVGIGAFAVLSLVGGAVPPVGASPGAMSREASSPTYSLNAQGNSARLLEAIPRIYGRVKTYPDLAAQPYTEYNGNFQYLYQLFCVSAGDVDVELVAVDDSDINNFEDAVYQIVKPGEAVTLFPDNVATSEAVQQLELLAPNNPNYAVVGPFVAVPSGQQANFLAVDIALPRGAANINDSGQKTSRSVSFLFEYQEINDAGAAVGPWQTLKAATLTFATERPQFQSYRVEVPDGRYQVRAYRTSTEGTDGRSFDNVQWVGLRAYMPSTHTYGNVTLIAVIMRATNVLNSQTARKFSVISTGKVSTWGPVDGWGPLVANRNPAWAAADILRNTDYGRGLPTSRFNVQKLYELAQKFDTRGDSFNAVFDTTSQMWEALRKVLKVGRTLPMYYAGYIDFIRDEPKSIVSAQFTSAQMVAGSFRTVYNFHRQDTPDHVIIEYIDEDTWTTQEVACVLPGSTANTSLRIELFGVTNRDQAWREGITMAAANRDRRRNIEFTTKKAGLVPSYNSLVRISHDVPSWGYAGEVISLDKATGIIITSEPLFQTDEPGWLIAFRNRDGSENGPFPIIPDNMFIEGQEPFGGKISGDLGDLADVYISDGYREDRTTYMAGPSTKRGILALATRCMPDANGQVSMQFMNESDSVHTAELGGNVPPPLPESNLPTTPSAPIVDGVDVVYTVIVGQQNILATPANGAIYYEFQARPDGQADWQAIGTQSDPQLSANLSPGIWEVRVRAIGRAIGPWATWAGAIEATTLPEPRLTSLAATKKLYDIGLQWAYDMAMATITDRIEIWESATNDRSTATRLVNLPYPADSFDRTNLAAAERRYFWARCVDTAGRIGPWFNNGNSITQISEDDAGKYTEVLQGQVSASMLTQELLEAIEGGGDAMIVVQELIDELSAMRTVKTQVRASDGKIITAGYGVGVTNDDGILQSEFVVAATNFYIIDPNNTSDPGKLMFAVNPEGVFIDSAFISKLTVQEALVGATIQSTATNSIGQPILSLNFETGEVLMNSRTPDGGSMTINNQLIEVFDPNGVRRIRLGIWE